jgi:phage terminase large subunit-like protein
MNVLQELAPYLTPQENAELTLLASLSSDPNLGAGDVDPLDWITNTFYLYDTGQLVSLFPCQIGPMQEALRQEHGRYVYDTVLWSWPKKSAKSTVVAAVADYVASAKANARIRLTGNDQRQADSRVGMYMRENIKLGAKAGLTVRQQTKVSTSGYNIRYPNGSVVEMVPIDPSGEAGGNDDMVVFSELWGWKHKAHQDMWAEMTISPNKHGDAQRWIDTYAGFQGEAPVLEPLYEAVVKPEYRIDCSYTDADGVFHDLSNVETYRNGTLFATWVTQHLFPWQTSEYYAGQARELTPDQFNRMHLNQWVSSTQAFVPFEWWAACQGDKPLIDNRYPMIIGVDAAVTSDCFAIVGVTRHDQRLAVRYVQVWKPPQGGEIDFTAPERELRRLCAEYNVIQIAYDKTELQDMAQRLRRDKVTWLKKFDQGAARASADKQLYDLIRDRRILHNGEPDLTEHIQNANADINKRENQLRLVKRGQQYKIDAAVALSMACAEALRLNL